MLVVLMTSRFPIMRKEEVGASCSCVTSLRFLFKLHCHLQSAMSRVNKRTSKAETTVIASPHYVPFNVNYPCYNKVFITEEYLLKKDKGKFITVLN
jgi:hypothetical protein